MFRVLGVYKVVVSFHIKVPAFGGLGPAPWLGQKNDKLLANKEP